MSHTQLLLCLFGITAVFFNNVEARLDGEGIIGGTESKDGQFPYQVSIEVDGKNICGGSILSNRFVITAAHCVIGKNNEFTRAPLQVVAGISDLKSRSRNRVAVKVFKVFVPGEYDGQEDTEKSRTTGDIAVLKLRKSLNLMVNSHLGKVNLPTTHETYAGKNANISGFGWNYVDVDVVFNTNHAEEVNGMSYGKMRNAVAKVLSNDACQKLYGRTNPIEDSHLCASVEQRDEDEPEGVCNGDSGGPLVYKGVQIGVISTSPLGCVEDRVPAVYTRVSDYVKFINNTVNGNVDENVRTATL